MAIMGWDEDDREKRKGMRAPQTESSIEITANDLREMESSICENCTVAVGINSDRVKFTARTFNKKGQPIWASYRMTAGEIYNLGRVNPLPLITEQLAKEIKEEKET